MRWEALLNDLEGQFDAARADEWRAEVSERTRGERAAIAMESRIAGARGTALTLTLADGATVTGVLRDSAHGWLLLADEADRDHLVPTPAVSSVRGLSGAAHHVTEVERRLRVSHVLRALSRDRARVRVRTAGGEVRGLIAAVFGDHIDVATAGPAGARVSVPFAAILEVVST